MTFSMISFDRTFQDFEHETADGTILRLTYVPAMKRWYLTARDLEGNELSTDGPTIEELSEAGL
jgi:hypothetical protein